MKFSVHHLNIIIYTNQEHTLGSEVNNLHYDFHQLQKIVICNPIIFQFE